LCPACLLELAAEAGTDPAGGADTGAACQVINVLGSNDHSRSYLADWTHGGRRIHVVLKTIDLHGPPDFAARVSAERRRLDALLIPGVARLFDAGLTAAGQPYFVYEYVRGLPVTIHCTQFALDREARRTLQRAIGDRLEAIHRAGLIHGAVKPSNVLIVGTPGAWQPTLLDLGVRSVLSPMLPAGNDAEDFARLVSALEGKLLPE
jgi:serine/threonine protein kinase